MNTTAKKQAISASAISRYLAGLFSLRSLGTDLGLLIIRLVCGLMAHHGWAKFDDFADGSGEWPDPFHVGPAVSKGLTVFAELFCTVLVVFGILTRPALIPLIICMLVIVFMVHGEDSFADREHPLMYLLLYLALFITGPGKYSIDRFIANRKV
ncbi:MAG TPA: DoxX family protein [Chitinophagaceae bacterium]|nr:DoxX family protein [Chitinophagaceae bacterium]